MLSVRDLSVAFPSRGGLLAAVREVSFEIAPGEVMALVGESGSGKSLTALAIMRLLPPQAICGGSISFQDQTLNANAARNGALSAQSEKSSAATPVELLTLPSEAMRQLRGARIAMIFQEPMTSLNPVMRVGDQVAEAVTAHEKVSRAEARARAVEALREVALPEPERRYRDYPHQLSGGMRQRVMIAMALVNRPQLLIADEPTTALDVNIQKQILELLAGLQARLKLALLFISHDLAVVANFAQRVAVMYAGSMVEIGGAREVFHNARHPYTQGLLKAMPSLRTERGRPLATLEGAVPALGNLPPGCAFEPRCDLRVASCRAALPPLIEVAPGHQVRCPVTTAAPAPNLSRG